MAREQNKWIDNLLDKCIGFIEWIQHKRFCRMVNKTWAKNKKEEQILQQKIDEAKKVLLDNGYSFERDWQNINYKGESYTPIMIEEYKESIIITAKKKERGN